MKNFNFFLICVLFAQVAFITATYSQITISSSDYEKNLDIPIKVVDYFSSDTSGLGSMISESGDSKTWDLTNRVYTAGSDTTTSTLLIKSTSGAPQQDYSVFSTATLVVRQHSSSEPLITNWLYESLTTAGRFSYGYVADSLGIVLSNQTNNPPMVSQAYPTTYLTDWSWNSSVNATTYKPSGGSVSVELDMSGNEIVDAYGTVITPEGTFPCLRIKSETNIFFGFFTMTSYSYSFVDQDRTYARIEADETGYIPSSVSYSKRVSPTGIPETFNIVSGDFLLQNYPNPFSSSTSIEFTLPRNEFVTLKVYNTYGKEVAVLINQWMSEGKQTVIFDGNNLPSGIYFYCLLVGRFTETKKLTVLR